MKIITPTTVTLFKDLKPLVVSNTHPNYAAIREAALEDDLELAVELADIVTAVKSYVATCDFTFDSIEETFSYMGKRLPFVLEDRIVAMLKEGADVSYLENFWLNLQANPSYRAVQELYDFLEAADLPITEDGCFVAYKSVREDFTDHRTGTFDNSVGAICEMPRNEVDEDKNRTCSSGLHFAAYNYASSFGGSSSLMIAIKIDPKDVVAIPSDYNNEKGRCCKYEVLKVVEGDSLTGKATYVDDCYKVTAYDAWRMDLDGCCLESHEEGFTYCHECGNKVEY